MQWRHHKKLLALLSLFLLFYLPDLVWAVLSGERIAGEGIAAASGSAAVLAVPFFALAVLLLRFCPFRFTAPVVLTLSALHSLLAAVAISHYSIYSHGISASSLYIALNSNVSEVVNYGRMYLRAPLVATLAGFFLLQAGMALAFVKTALASSPLRGGEVALMALAGVVAQHFLAPLLPERHKMLDHCVATYRQYTYDRGKMNVMRVRNSRSGALSAVRAEGVAARETYVLVIGESVSRSHMGLYGYFRNTTPLLSARRDELIVYNDVLSASFCTYLSLRKMLTFANYDDMTPLYDHHLVDIMKAAGFTTYWISNQKAHNMGDIWSKYFSEAADERVYLNTAEFSDPLDGVLLEPFEDMLKKKAQKKFIVVHMMGSHLHAANRYPAAFRRFPCSGEEDAYFSGRSKETREYINHYDNSILYTDQILDSLIARLGESEGARMLLFLSDHSDQLGENDDFLGRSYRKNRHQFEIPFLVWLSPEYLEARGELGKRIESYVDRPFQADDLIHSFMELAGVSAAKFEPRRSLFNKGYQPGTRHMEIPLEPDLNVLPAVARE